MSLLTLVVLAGVVTYASRAAAVVLLPEPRGMLRTFIDRLPAPLFAALAVSNLVGNATVWPEPPALCAAAAAAATTPRRSLPLALVVGLAAYGLAELIW